MKKQKFTITKHNRANGTSYYTCTVEIESVRRCKNLIELFRYGSKGVPCVVSSYLDESGIACKTQKTMFNERSMALISIFRYTELRELKESKKVVSTEIEVIYK